MTVLFLGDYSPLCPNQKKLQRKRDMAVLPGCKEQVGTARVWAGSNARGQIFIGKAVAEQITPILHCFSAAVSHSEGC